MSLPVPKTLAKALNLLVDDVEDVFLKALVLRHFLHLTLAQCGQLLEYLSRKRVLGCHVFTLARLIPFHPSLSSFFEAHLATLGGRADPLQPFPPFPGFSFFTFNLSLLLVFPLHIFHERHLTPLLGLGSFSFSQRREKLYRQLVFPVHRGAFRLTALIYDGKCRFNVSFVAEHHLHFVCLVPRSL